MAELKPCPFCGGEAVVIDNGCFVDVSCKNFQCRGWAESLMYKNKEEAIEEWNRRAEGGAENTGCEYCSGEFAEYQHTCNTKLFINTFGKARTIETECNPCPPFARCSLRGNPARSAFIINYCPHCGRKLGD